MMRAAEGDEGAFVDLVHRHQNGLLNFFGRMGAYHDSEDLVQETFVRLYKARATYRPSARLKTFLYVLARHVWADRGRRLARQERLRASLEAGVTTEAGERRAHREGVDVAAGLAKLSPKLREVLVLNVYQELRYQEIADILGIPLGTVKSRISLALHAMRRILDEQRR